MEALSVYLEPLAAGARVAVVGDAELELAPALLELGARSVLVYDPDRARAARASRLAPRGVAVRSLEGDFDVRDAAFDVVVLPDAGALPDLGAALGQVRRVVDARGAVVALARARVEAAAEDAAAFAEVGPATLEYAELYDLFALRFETVTMMGVLPFAGVVFAELGAGEDVAVSVDTRAAPAVAPDVFLVVASRDLRALEPYAIVQVEPPTAAAAPAPSDGAADAAFAAMQLKAELLSSQVDELRARLAAAEARGSESSARFERIAQERDMALARAREADLILARVAELEGALAVAQQGVLELERRLMSAEQGMLERDDRIAALHAELDAARAVPEELADVIDPRLVAELAERAERAEAALALHVADLAHVADAHAAETASLEEQLRDRARVIASLEREIARREHLVRELIVSLEEAQQGAAHHGFQQAPPLAEVDADQVARLRRKLDELALEIARREGELVARGWRIGELEAELAAAAGARSAHPGVSPELQRDLARAKDELDALRQALAQEHAARVAAESGEELARARSELARQAALLDQMRARVRPDEGDAPRPGDGS